MPLPCVRPRRARSVHARVERRVRHDLQVLREIPARTLQDGGRDDGREEVAGLCPPGVVVALPSYWSAFSRAGSPDEARRLTKGQKHCYGVIQIPLSRVALFCGRRRTGLFYVAGEHGFSIVCMRLVSSSAFSTYCNEVRLNSKYGPFFFWRWSRPVGGHMQYCN